MIDFDIYEDSDANKPRRRRRSSKKRVSLWDEDDSVLRERLLLLRSFSARNTCARFRSLYRRLASCSMAWVAVEP